MEKRISEILPELGLVVFLLPANVGIPMECVLVNKALDRFGYFHCFVI